MQRLEKFNMEQPRCPECKEPIEIGVGVFFDKAHNVICANCEAVVMASTFQEERITKQTTTTSPHANSYHHHPYGQGYKGVYPDSEMMD
jgi:uncharacterized Zn finger protein (UPF0148 family)